MIEKYPDKLWNWTTLSKNKKLLFEIFDKYPDHEWHWFQLHKISTKNYYLK